MTLVEVDNVTKEYISGEEKISPLKDANLQVQAGDFLSLMGASGSGKSTLLRALLGLAADAEVSVDVRGRREVFALTKPPFVDPSVRED